MSTTGRTASRGVRPTPQAGFMLVEVIMTSLVVALVGMGVFLGIEGATRGSGNNKQRSVAAALAQQDQERLRAFKTTDLSNYKERRTVTVAGVPYTIDSSAQWVSDSSGVLSCTNGSQRANYLKINSSITWPRMRQRKPVAIDSLVAPHPGSFSTNQGSLAIQLQDQAAGPVAGVPISLGPPASLTRTTDSQGCAVFGGVNAGSYDASWSSSGWVDPGGRNAVTERVSVVAGTTSLVNFLYGQAAAIDVRFDTKVGSNPPQAGRSWTVTVSNSNLPAPGRRVFDPTGGARARIEATDLYPFTSGYGVYAGDCANNDPTIYDGTYYERNPGLVTTTPAGSHSVTVRAPALNIAVTRGGVPLENAQVRVTLTSTGCSGSVTTTTNAQGALTEPGVPFGTYGVCASDGTKRITRTNVQNHTPGGTAVVALETNSGVDGTC